MVCNIQSQPWLRKVCERLWSTLCLQRLPRIYYFGRSAILKNFFRRRNAIRGDAFGRRFNSNQRSQLLLQNTPPPPLQVPEMFKLIDRFLRIHEANSSYTLCERRRRERESMSVSSRNDAIFHHFEPRKHPSTNGWTPPVDRKSGTRPLHTTITFPSRPAGQKYGKPCMYAERQWRTRSKLIISCKFDQSLSICASFGNLALD